MGNTSCAERKDDLFYAGRFIKHHARSLSHEFCTSYEEVREQAKEKVFEAKFQMKYKNG